VCVCVCGLVNTYVSVPWVPYSDRPVDVDRTETRIGNVSTAQPTQL